jgi:hypothetical protein
LLRDEWIAAKNTKMHKKEGSATRNFLCLFAFFVAINSRLRAKPALGPFASIRGSITIPLYALALSLNLL